MPKTGAVSAERYLVVAAFISVLVAGVCSMLPLLAFGSFGTMAGVLVASDLVIYALMKMGLFDRPGSV